MKNVSVDVRAGSDVHSVGPWAALSVSLCAFSGCVCCLLHARPFTEKSSLKFLNQPGQLSPGFMAMLGRDRPLGTECFTRDPRAVRNAPGQSQ